MRSVEGEGGSIDEAIARALAALGVERDRVEIEILENAKAGLFGIGRRKARVRARIRAPLTTWLVQAVKSRGAHGEPAAAAGSASRARDGTGEVSGNCAALLDEILRRMGVRARITRRDGQDGEHILDVQGPDTDAVVGRRGEVIDALEYLVNRMAERVGDGTRRVVVDADGHRAKRQTAIEELVRQAAARARQRKKPVTLDPLGATDRRIAHLVLKSEAGVRGRSIGEGLYRKLVVIPEGTRRGGSKGKR